MKPVFSLLLFGSFLFSPALSAQDDANIVFKFRCVPTSTTDYSIEITSNKFILNTSEKITDREGHIKRIVPSSYTHLFDSREKEMLDTIISINKLDSVGLYQDRKTEWGTLWEVEIQRNSIIYSIRLPNYNNAGLESLIRFIVCLIPKKERPLYECKKCS